ncbi:hypothetical protein FACS1894200_04950 [Spirochaetia bacterium]|nr:hypothetical protein FACS1894200_04950 [Spirochaetia bacterium]
MVQVTLKCPHCGSENVGKIGYSNGKQRYACKEAGCHKTFYTEYEYNGCKPDVKHAIIKWSIDGAGIRAIARQLEISTGTVLSELRKKENLIDNVNKAYLETHKHVKLEIEMDEMWSFYGDKHHQIWLWWAIDHETGAVVAFWFGSREHKNLDKLIELLSPLQIGKVYADGNYAYFDRFDSDTLVVSKKNTQKIERKHLSLRTWTA